MEIRQIEAAERQAVSMPVQAYAFQPSPAPAELVRRLEDVQRYYEGNVTLVAEDDGVAVAEVSAIPMQQNLRGVVYPMAGVAGWPPSHWRGAAGM
jgi:predicted N-acetyltransferase YhbS